MVFSSVPVYLDPPNWQQQSNHQHGSESQNLQLPPLPPPHHHVGGSGGGAAAGSIRAGSMSDRARLAKIPQPEAALKCPRCESTNTKFCYFNNYSLTQPRHFCKTCRRYWTRGGALRNVPVGGGCRRNKKSKSNRSKSPASAERQTGPNSSSAIPSGCSTEMIGHLPHQPLQLPFMASLQNFSRLGAGNIGLNFSEIQGQTDIGYQIGSNSCGAGADQWRLQQFPFFGNFESPTAGLYSVQNECVEEPSPLAGDGGQLRTMTSSSRATTQLPPSKMEGSQGQNLSRPSLGMSENNQFWGGNAWTDSSTSHLL